MGGVRTPDGIGVCRAAGCVVTNLTGQPLRLRDRGVVAAADPASRALLLAGIAEQLPISVA